LEQQVFASQKIKQGWKKKPPPSVPPKNVSKLRFRYFAHQFR
jgi:hypothetical protein